jgi:hypothetical protein
VLPKDGVGQCPATSWEISGNIQVTVETFPPIFPREMRDVFALPKKKTSGSIDIEPDVAWRQYKL